MSDAVSRLAIALAGLPIVLAIAYVGGWLLTGLALAAAVLAMHELYTIARDLRPLVLAGYGAAAAGLVGATLAGPVWLLGGLLVVFVLAFAFAAVSVTRQSTTVALATTVFGAFWIAGGLGLLMLLREDASSNTEGRYWIFGTLICVFVTDTFAYAGGRIAGRHKMSPTISPGKTWEGWLFGAAAGIVAAWITFYDTGYLRRLARDRLRCGDRGVGDDRRPLRIARETRPRRQGHGTDPGRPRRRPRPRRLAPLRRAGGVLHSPGPGRPVGTLDGVKRIALLGATGSIGLQALEIVDMHPELELCAVAVGSRADDGRRIAAERGVENVSIGGDPPLDELVEESDPDVVLNAVVGFAGLPATLAALEAGIDLALANKESLVAAGDLALAAQRTGRRPDPPGRLGALGRVPVPRGPRHGAGGVPRAHRVGGAVPWAARVPSSRHVTPSEALAHPTWSMGPKITIDSAT